MSSIDEVQSALVRCFGLSPRDGWPAALEKAAIELGDAINLPYDQVLERALTDTHLLKKIASHITIPESFFFRQSEQLTFIAERVKQQLSQPDGSLRMYIWSAGCSQGEEPLSLAILLYEQLSPAEMARVSIIGSDINAKVIAAAKDGVYTSWNLRGIDAKRQHTYFKEIAPDRFRLRPDILSMVDFHHRSIQEQLYLFGAESIDVVIFRNVAIYLSKESLPLLCESICSRLKVGGILCISHSDPAINQPDMSIVDSQLGAVYQKSSQMVPSTDRSCTVPIPVPVPVPVPGSRNTEARSQVKKQKKQKISADPLLKPRDGTFRTGKFALQARELTKAEVYFRNAVFNSPDDPEARFWYAVALFEANVQNRSRAQLNALIDSLSNMDEHQLLKDGNTTVGELLSNAHLLLNKMR